MKKTINKTVSVSYDCTGNRLRITVNDGFTGWHTVAEGQPEKIIEALPSDALVRHIAFNAPRQFVAPFVKALVECNYLILATNEWVPVDKVPTRMRELTRRGICTDVLDMQGNVVDTNIHYYDYWYDEHSREIRMCPDYAPEKPYRLLVFYKGGTCIEQHDCESYGELEWVLESWQHGDFNDPALIDHYECQVYCTTHGWQTMMGQDCCRCVRQEVNEWEERALEAADVPSPTAEDIPF